MRQTLGLGIAIVAAALTAGCAAGKLRPGPHKAGQVVEAEGRDPAQAERSAVESLFGLYLSSAARHAAAAALDQKILSNTGAYIKRFETVDSQSRGGAPTTRIRALVLVQKLGQDLDALGLVRPAGVRGRPKVMIALREKSASRPGRASDALRLALLERGYAAVDLSDPLSGDARSASSASAAMAEARRLDAQALVTGAAETSALEDGRLEGYHPAKARVTAEVTLLGAAQPAWPLAVEASAVDILPESASEKALSNAGELAADRLIGFLASRYQQRTEMEVAVLGLGGLDQAQGLIEAIRRLPQVAGAALDGASAPDAKVRVFVEQLSADELAAALMRVDGYSLTVRSVEPDYNYLELEGRSKL